MDPLIVLIIYKYYRIKIIPKLLFCLNDTKYNYYSYIISRENK